MLALPLLNLNDSLMIFFHIYVYLKRYIPICHITLITLKSYMDLVSIINCFLIKLQMLISIVEVPSIACSTKPFKILLIFYQDVIYFFSHNICIQDLRNKSLKNSFIIQPIFKTNCLTPILHQAFSVEFNLTHIKYQI